LVMKILVVTGVAVVWAPKPLILKNPHLGPLPLHNAKVTL
jgi:hypothetical protein